MSRIDRHHGLNSWASNVVNINAEVEDPIKKEARRIFLSEMERCGSYAGTDGTQYPLFQFRLPNGRVFKERILGSTISLMGGRDFFMVLVNEKGAIIPESIWDTDERMRKLGFLR